MLLICKIESDFVPGRPGTEEFVPGQEQEPLSRDKGTPEQDFFLSQDKGTTGQGNFFCPGTKGQRDVPSHGNPSSK